MYMKKILIVEDESSLRRAIGDKLALEKAIFLEAKNGEEGLRVALEEHPDLILLDIVMPKMDGFVMLENLRHDDWGKTARVVILTNLDNEEYVLKSFHNEVYDYIVKTNIRMDDLISKIKEKLK